jgi:WD40 repeat protein
MAVSPDGRFLLSAESPSESALSGDANHRPVRLWQLPRGEPLCEFGIAGASVQSVAFSPDGKTLATTDRQGVTLWDAASCEARATLRFADAGPLGPVVFSPNGSTLTAGGRTAIISWNAASN